MYVCRQSTLTFTTLQLQDPIELLLPMRRALRNETGHAQHLASWPNLCRFSALISMQGLLKTLFWLANNVGEFCN